MPNEPTPKALFDPREADAKYEPFPSFADWAAQVSLDEARWGRYTARLEGLRKESSPELLKKAKEVVERAAAVDTGAIEGLYETDRGFTFTVATEAVLWQSVVEEKKGSQVLALIKSQLRAYDYVLDFATQKVPLAEAWIRKLHEEICRDQKTYAAYTEVGKQELPLPKGEYKHLPNHIRRQDGQIHAHAPVDLTPAEMYRLCQELRAAAFAAAHPVLQASYAHYAFVRIHPFADGNGRTARALASIFTYRSSSVPLMILTDNKGAYFDSLEKADAGRYQNFADFIMERVIDSIQLFEESIKAARQPTFAEASAQFKSLYQTKGGYTQAEVDEAGYKLIELFQEAISQELEKVRQLKTVTVGKNNGPNGHEIVADSYRLPVRDSPRYFNFNLAVVAPLKASVSRHFGLEVPKDCDREDSLIIRETKKDLGVTAQIAMPTKEALKEALKSVFTHQFNHFYARINELHPVPTGALQMRLKIAAEAIVNEALNELLKLAAENPQS